jgi:hypothetical protein
VIAALALAANAAPMEAWRAGAAAGRDEVLERALASVRGESG